MGNNPNDPLLKVDDRERELFMQMTKVAASFPIELVIGAALNLVVNAVRQGHAAQRSALDSYDSVASRGREVLAGHYDAVGKRRNVFPFHQRVEVSLFDNRRKN